MGVVNATPDSFYQAGRSETEAAACERITQLYAQGAEIVDIGGESSRPGAESVDADEQLARIEGPLRHAIKTPKLTVSVDTTNPRVAERALEMGAMLVNDVSCLSDVDLARVTARRGGVLILMHTRGDLGSMTGFSEYPDDAYDDVVADVRREWCEARARAEAAGLSRDRIWFDPGIGFAKDAGHSYEVLARLQDFAELGRPVLVGPSRKSFLSRPLGGALAPEQRDWATAAAVTAAVLAGFLRNRGFRVTTAGSAEAALRAVESDVVDLVLTDLRMPGRSGVCSDPVPAKVSSRSSSPLTTVASRRMPRRMASGVG